MPHVLHLLKPPIPDEALTTIARQSHEPDTTVGVVLMHDAEAPSLPGADRVLHLAETSPTGRGEALTYTALLDLIFSADQVITW